jgi:hypothetical protein
MMIIFIQQVLKRAVPGLFLGNGPRTCRTSKEQDRKVSLSLLSGEHRADPCK